MGTNLQSNRDMNVRRRSSKQDSEGGLAASIMNLLKQGCLCAGSTVTDRKKQFHPQENKNPQLKNKGVKNKGVEFVTLEEWILASPCLNVGNAVGDHQFHQLSKQASKRVHPSFDRTHQEGCLSKSRESFSSIERSISISSMRVLERVERGEVADYSFCRTQGGKLKKKVSFRLPEVADVFILDSPESQI